MEEWTAILAAFGEGRSLKKSGNMKETPQNWISGALAGSYALLVFVFNQAAVNCERYRAMLQDFLIPELRLLNLLDTNFFQQDGAPCH